jgi:hypothetical protein
MNSSFLTRTQLINPVSLHPAATAMGRMLFDAEDLQLQSLTGCL